MSIIRCKTRIYSTLSIVRYIGKVLNNLESISIPDSVTSIGDYAFVHCSSLTNISIPDGVTSIGMWEFYGCYALTSVTIPNTVKSIGQEAFCDCKNLKDAILPKGVTYIDDGAFEGCSSLDSVIIPDSVTWIGYHAFMDCINVESITIPDSVITICGGAFDGCASLKDVYYIGERWNDSRLYFGDTYFSNAKIHIISASGTCGDSLTWQIDTYNDILFINGTGAMSNWTSEDIIWGGGYYDAKHIILDSGVTSIGDYAFQYFNNLKSITIPDSVTSIGNCAFRDCNYLESITFSKNLISIGNGAFSGCDKLESVSIPNGVTSIGNSAFWDCTRLTTVIIPDSIKLIGYNAFTKRYGRYVQDIYYSGSSFKTVVTTGAFDSRSDFHFNGIKETVSDVITVQEEGETGATGFTAALENIKGSETTAADILWRVTANGESKEFEVELPSVVTLENGAGAVIGLIVNGLYDEQATAKAIVK